MIKMITSAVIMEVKIMNDVQIALTIGRIEEYDEEEREKYDLFINTMTLLVEKYGNIILQSLEATA